MLSNLLKTTLGRFRIVAFLEGCSYILLGFTMVLKYNFNIPEPNWIVGMLHGLLFILYMVLAFYLFLTQKWKLSEMFWTLLAAFLPFGTFIADHMIFKPKLN